MCKITHTGHDLNDSVAAAAEICPKDASETVRERGGDQSLEISTLDAARSCNFCW